MLLRVLRVDAKKRFSWRIFGLRARVVLVGVRGEVLRRHLFTVLVGSRSRRANSHLSMRATSFVYPRTGGTRRGVAMQVHALAVKLCGCTVSFWGSARGSRSTIRIVSVVTVVVATFATQRDSRMPVTLSAQHHDQDVVAFTGAAVSGSQLSSQRIGSSVLGGSRRSMPLCAHGVRESDASTEGFVQRDRILLDTGPSPHSLGRIQSFMRCPQLYCYQYELGHRGPPSQPLVRGSLIHVGGAHHAARIQAIRLGQDPERYYDPLTAMALTADKSREEWGTLPMVLLEPCQKVVHDFMEQEMFTDVDIGYVEAPFSFDVKDPTTGKVYSYTQKPDCIVRRHDTGRIKHRDLKTSAVRGEASYRRYATDIKMIALQWWGPTVFGSVYGGVEVYSIGVGAEPHFKVHDLEVAFGLISQFPAMVLRVERAIEVLRAANIPPEQWDKNATELTCFHSYGACDFRDPCMMGSSAKPLVQITRGANLVW